MANILVIEDDPVQRKILVKMLGEIGDNNNILEAGSGEEAINLVRDEKIDLFYIDINLPDITGIEFAEKIREYEEYKLTWIVFITTNAQYMLQAFKGVHCYDYIIKPYDKKIIQDITIKLLKGLNIVGRGIDGQRKSIKLDIKGIIVMVNVEEIIFIEISLRTCLVHTIRGVYRVNNLSLKKVMEMLQGTKLVQSHKSYVINPDYIREIDKGGSSWCIQFEGCKEVAYIGDKFRKQAINHLEKFKFREAGV